MTWLLLCLLIFTNWCWLVFFTSYRRTIVEEVAKRKRAGITAKGG